MMKSYCFACLCVANNSLGTECQWLHHEWCHNPGALNTRIMCLFETKVLVTKVYSSVYYSHYLALKTINLCKHNFFLGIVDRPSNLSGCGLGDLAEWAKPVFWWNHTAGLGANVYRNLYLICWPCIFIFDICRRLCLYLMFVFGVYDQIHSEYQHLC